MAFVKQGAPQDFDFEIGRRKTQLKRLTNPLSGQPAKWVEYTGFANARSGTMTTPTLGGFNNGRGEFYSTDTFDGRDILVRFVISDVKADSANFEQAFSADGGKTWEVNWIAVDTRVP